MIMETTHSRLGLRQSTKLAEIQRAIQELGSTVQHIRSTLQNTSLPSTSISGLENKMARLSLARDELQKEHVIIKSLNFDARPSRYDGIPEAHEKTFRWVFEDANILDHEANTGNLLEWLQQGDGIFWISGKPGSGKSTLMKFVSHHEKTEEALSLWSRKEPMIIASHFFWHAGTAMQKSRQGLLRSLLFDILRQQPDLVEKLCPGRWKRAISQLLFEDWKTPELRQALQRISHLKRVAGRFCFFIDGLDEYEGDHAEFCETLKSLSESPYVKLCVASRPWNVFEYSFGRVVSSKIYIHELTRKDIHEYVEANLTQHPRWNELIQETKKAASLVRRVTKKSSGVFLWVYLATKELRSGMSEYDSYLDLRLRLKKNPGDLEAFFKKILESVDSFHHQKMAESLQLSLIVREPVPTDLYYFQDMDFLDQDYALNLPFNGRTDEKTLSHHRLATRRLNGRCRGLLEVNPSSSCVEFLHRTVMEYLETPEMTDYLRCKARPNFDAHHSALKAFTAYIKSTKFVETKKHGGYTECEKPEFLKALKEVLFHAKELNEITGVYQLLESLERGIPDLYKTRQVSLLVSGDPLVHGNLVMKQFILDNRYAGYLNYMARRVPGYLSAFQPLQKPILRTAVTLFFDDYPPTDRILPVLRVLLANGCDPNEQCVSPLPSESTPWRHFLNCDWLWDPSETFAHPLESGGVSLLLEHGADPYALVYHVKYQDYLYDPDDREEVGYKNAIHRYEEEGRFTTDCRCKYESWIQVFLDLLIKTEISTNIMKRSLEVLDLTIAGFTATRSGTEDVGKDVGYSTSADLLPGLDFYPLFERIEYKCTSQTLSFWTQVVERIISIARLHNMDVDPLLPELEQAFPLSLSPPNCNSTLVQRHQSVLGEAGKEGTGLQKRRLDCMHDRSQVNGKRQCT